MSASNIPNFQKSQININHSHLSTEKVIKSDQNTPKIHTKLDRLVGETSIKAMRKGLEDYLTRVIKVPGFLAMDGEKLVVTDDMVHAKKTIGLVDMYLTELEGKISPKILAEVSHRVMDEKMKMQTSSMPSSTLGTLLESHRKAHGLTSALNLLDQICHEKELQSKRYAPVHPWPATRSTQYLHITPNEGLATPTPLPTPQTRIGTEGPTSIILTMIEPSLEESIDIGGRKISNAELLITDVKHLKLAIKELPETEQTSILDTKKKLDAFYKNKALFSYKYRDPAGKTKTLTVTEPTTRYVDKQFLVVASTDRKDLLATAQADQDAGHQRFLNRPERHRRNSITSFSHEPPGPAKVQKMLDDTKSSIQEASTDSPPISQNVSDVRTMAHLLTDLPGESLIGQNAFESSTDANYQHFQLFVEAPCHLIPAFQAPTELKYKTSYTDDSGKEQWVECSRVRPESFHGSIFRISASSSNKETIAFLESIQNQFLGAPNNGPSFSLVGRKTSDGTYEYYFILRKSIEAHPHLQREAVQMGLTRPGWAEMMGVRIAKTAQAFEDFPDASYQPFLQNFAVEHKECEAFETLMKTELRKIGDVKHNLVETFLRSLRSDAETSKMYHCILLNNSKTAEDGLALAINAPQDMQPNLMIIPQKVEHENQTFDTVAKEIAETMLLRKANRKNFGVVAVDENVLTALPEFQLLKKDLAALREDYATVRETVSFKTFLMNHYAFNTEVKTFISLLKDVDVEKFLKDPIPISEINIHQALIRQASRHLKEMCTNTEANRSLWADKGFDARQIELLTEKDPPNIRCEEYAYGDTTLTTLPSKAIGPEEFAKSQEAAKLLGGNKFNTHASQKLQDRANTIFMKQKALTIMHKHFSPSALKKNGKEKAIREVADLLIETYNPKSSHNVNSACSLLKELVIDASKTSDLLIPRTFLRDIKMELLSRVARTMIPVFKERGESYSLSQVSFDKSALPPEFQYKGKIVPCDFTSYISPMGTPCCESSAFDSPVVPTGKKIAIVMNGGQASGVGEVAIGAILAAGPQNDVYVFVHGNDGLIRGDSVKASLSDLELIRSQGGFPGGTTRTPLVGDNIEKVKENLKGFDGVIFIGGDGSYQANKSVFLDAGVPVYFCIKTIDGDFHVEDTDFTLGFYTAIEGYGDMIEDRMQSAKKNHEFHFLQVGGRFAGFLAVGTGALLPPESRPNMAIYPEEIAERQWSFKDVVDILTKSVTQRIALDKPYGVFSVAEGCIQELPEVKELTREITKIRRKHPDITGEELKDYLMSALPRTPSVEGQLSLFETLNAFSDEDIILLGTTDAVGRVPVAQIDTYTALGRLVENRLKSLQTNPSQLIDIVDSPNGDMEISEHVLRGKLQLTEGQAEKFKTSPLPVMKGTKSNYDQRSRPAIKQDYSNGLLQGMTAVSAALFNKSIDGQHSAIIATSVGRGKTVAISTKVEAGGESISPSHPYVIARNANLSTDLIK